MLQNAFCSGSFFWLVSTRKVFHVVCCFFALFHCLCFRLVVEIVALRDFNQVSFIGRLPLQQWDRQLSFIAAELSDEAGGRSVNTSLNCENMLNI